MKIFTKAKEYFKKKEEEYKHIQLNRESVNCPCCEFLYRPAQISEDTLGTKKPDKTSGSNKSQSYSFLRCRQCGKIFGVEHNHYFEIRMYTNTAFKIE